LYIACLMVAWTGPDRACAASPDSTLSLYRQHTVLVLVPGQSSAVLPDRFIVAGSDTLTTPAGRLVREQDYTVDHAGGQIHFLHPFADTTRVSASYHRLPVALSRAYSRRRLVIERVLPDSAEARPLHPPEDRPSAFPSPARGASLLRASGSKTFSVVTGSNRDASLEQSLRIQIAGRPASNMEVLAVLSDKSNPIQPDGTTRQLQELDNVFVQIKTPALTTTMGDHTVVAGQTRFTRYERKLKGVQGEVKLPGGAFQMAAAVSEGRYTTNTLQGVEGVQGPYQLTDESGNRNILVAAGTEKVWVDGVRMVRGDDNDYTIDYTNAQITFTRNRLITGDARIIVDFEASDGQYRRTLYLGRGTYAVGEHATFGATVLREGDDRGDPQAVALTPDDIRRPTSHTLAGVDLQAEPVSGLSVAGEWAYSALNPNTFADPAHRQVTGGGAFLLSTRYAPASSSLGDLELYGTVRSVEGGFQPAGRIDDAEYHRRYDQGAAASWRGRLLELGGTHRMGPFLSVSGSMGRLGRPDGFASSRWEAGFTASPHRGAELSYRQERIASHTPGAGGEASASGPAAGGWLRQRADAVFTFGWLRPRLGFEQERRAERTDGALRDGHTYTEWRAGMETVRFKRFSALTEFARRASGVVADLDAQTRAWQQQAVSRTYRHRLSLQEWKSLAASLQVIQRYSARSAASGAERRDYLVDSRLFYTPLHRMVSLDGRYEVSSARSARSSRQYVHVGRGRGDFRLDPLTGEFVPDPDGEYVERFDQVGEFTPVNGIKSSVRLALQPGLGRDSSSHPLRNLSSETFFAVDIRRRAGESETSRFSPFAGFRQDSTTVFGSLALRQDIFLFPQNRQASIRLRYQRNHTLNNQLITGGERRFQEEYGIRLRAAVTLRSTVEAQFARQSKIRGDFGRDLFRILSYQGALDLACRPAPPLELGVRMTGGRDTEQRNRITAALFSLAPRLVRYVQGRGRALFEVDWAVVRSTPATAFLPYEMVNGRRAGHSARWVGSVDYQLGRNLSMLMQYDGRKDPSRPSVHTGRVEVRAVF
jgi:hypothetical protein